MVSTEWKSPSNITQDARYKIVNGGTANKFGNLNAMKTQNTKDWTYILKDGTSDYRASPILYFNNFGFSIPKSATITKVHMEMVVQEQTLRTGIKTKLVKLKTGASTTDTGVGNNKASNDKWSERPKWTTQTYSYTPSEWGIPLQASQVNNTNFGCVIQCVGTADGHKGWGYWSLPRIAYVRMKIDYTLPDTQTTIEKAKFKIEASLSKNTIDINNSNDYTNLSVNYTHLVSSNNQYVEGNTPTVDVSSNNLKIGTNKANTYTCPILNFPNETSSSTKSTIIPIYPGVQPGIHQILLKSSETTITLQVEVINSRDNTIELTDFTKYDKANQKLIINNCKFKGCNSKTGGALYIKTKNYHSQDNIFENNTATTCPNIWYNKECKTE